MLSVTGNRYQTRFTLIELICVLAISMLLLGLVIGRVGRIPVFLSLNQVALNIQDIINTAMVQADLNGKPLILEYANNEFRIIFPDRFPGGDFRDYFSYTIPSWVTVSFGNTVDNYKFIFYPDGLSYGPDILLSAKEQKARIHISALTGNPKLTFE